MIVRFRDKRGYSVCVRRMMPSERDKLVEMYLKFDPGDRCMGLPPLTREGIERWVDYLLENGCNFVAVVSGKIVAHTSVVPVGEDAELDIFVLKDYQGRGIGKELLRYTINFCKGRFKGIHVFTSCSNLRAKNFFKRFGFKVISEDGDECHMYLRLA